MTADFDFDQCVEQAWRRFALRLEDILSMMDETEPLTLEPSQGCGTWVVRFTQPAKDTLTAFTGVGVAGAALLDDDQRASLEQLGWTPHADGYRLSVSQDRCAELAGAVIDVLRRVYNVAHPVFLDSNVLAEILQEPEFVEPGYPAHSEETLAYGPLDDVQLAAAVADEMSQVLGSVPMRDQEGDFAIRAGSTMIFVRIPPDGREIRLFSVIVHDVSGRSRATEVLNDVNAHTRWVRFSLVRDTIIATMSIMASPFVPAHLRQAITEMTNVADGVDDLLASSLEGKTTFPRES